LLPELAAPRIAGDNPWREIQQLRNAAGAGTAPAERSVESAELGSTARHYPLSVKSEPSGAQVFADTATSAVCHTPNEIRASAGAYDLRLSLSGYEDDSRHVRVAARAGEVDVPLKPARGSVIVETGAAGAVTVNETAVPAQGPVEIALVPGLYRISADFGSVTRGRLLMVKPSARLRLKLNP
jgi:hypothetical protein